MVCYKKMFIVTLFINIFAPILRATPLTEMIKEWDDKVSAWQVYYDLSLFVVISIAVLGVFLGLLQIFSRKFTKNVAIIFSFSVTLTTVVVNMTDMKDHKEINQSIANAEKIITKLKELNAWSLLKENDINDQLILMQDAAKRTGALHKIQGSLPYYDLSFSIIPVAYAQPSWTNFESLKADKNGVFRIIGIGEGSKLSDAKEAAYENINFQIEGYLQQAIKENFREKISEQEMQDEKVVLLIDNISKLALNLIKNLEAAKTHFEEEKNKTYKYYVLYQLSEKQLEESIRLYSYIFAK